MDALIAVGADRLRDSPLRLGAGWTVLRKHNRLPREVQPMPASHKSSTAIIGESSRTLTKLSPEWRACYNFANGGFRLGPCFLCAPGGSDGFLSAA